MSKTLFAVTSVEHQVAEGKRLVLNFKTEFDADNLNINQTQVTGYWQISKVVGEGIVEDLKVFNKTIMKGGKATMIVCSSHDIPSKALQKYRTVVGHILATSISKIKRHGVTV
jgi:hypothetical protein